MRASSADGRLHRSSSGRSQSAAHNRRHPGSVPDSREAPRSPLRKLSEERVLTGVRIRWGSRQWRTGRGSDATPGTHLPRRFPGRSAAVIHRQPGAPGARRSPGLAPPADEDRGAGADRHTRRAAGSRVGTWRARPTRAGVTLSASSRACSLRRSASCGLEASFTLGTQRHRALRASSRVKDRTQVEENPCVEVVGLVCHDAPGRGAAASGRPGPPSVRSATSARSTVLVRIEAPGAAQVIEPLLDLGAGDDSPRGRESTAYSPLGLQATSRAGSARARPRRETPTATACSGGRTFERQARLSLGRGRALVCRAMRRWVLAGGATALIVMPAVLAFFSGGSSTSLGSSPRWSPWALVIVGGNREAPAVAAVTSPARLALLGLALLCGVGRPLAHPGRR